MRVMYWNSTAPAWGGGTQAELKQEVIQAIVKQVQPDVVCLDEVSASIDDTQAMDSFATNVLNTNSGKYESGNLVGNPGAHLNTATWVKEGFSYKNIQEGLPKATWDTDKTKRNLTRVQFRQSQKDISIWFLHANASKSGGATAVELAALSVKGTYQAILGDFNCPIGDVKYGTAVAPLVGKCQFTQWKTDDFGTTIVPGTNPPKKFTPHGMIDFAMVEGKFLSLKPVDTIGHLKDEDLREVILRFDHFPIAYDIAVV
jgi:endonuclease/exonuclease/phosphatase family metal-dependent hydrolase